MTITVYREKEGVTNTDKLFNLVSDDSLLGGRFSGISTNGSSSIGFTFSGNASLSTNQETAIDDILEVFTNDPVPVQLASQEIAETANFSTTSTSGIEIPDMNATPRVGSYYVNFSTAGNISSAPATVTMHVAINDVTIPQSVKRRTLTSTSTGFTMNVQALVEVDGTDEIKIYISTSAGTVTIEERTLCLVETEL